MTGIGMANAADTTETALNHFTPEPGIAVDAVVFVGVAGGSGRTQIGDVAVPARWTFDDGATWHPVDPDMLAAAQTLTVDLDSTGSIGDPACRLCGPFARLPLIDLKREPQLYVGGDGSSDDNNNGAAFPAIPLGGAVFGPQPLAAPDYSPLFTGNFFQALGPFLARGLLSNITGFLTATNPPVDAVDQETAAAQQVAECARCPVPRHPGYVRRARRPAEPAGLSVHVRRLQADRCGQRRQRRRGLPGELGRRLRLAAGAAVDRVVLDVRTRSIGQGQATDDRDDRSDDDVDRDRIGRAGLVE